MFLKFKHKTLLDNKYKWYKKLKNYNNIYNNLLFKTTKLSSKNFHYRKKNTI